MWLSRAAWFATLLIPRLPAGLRTHVLSVIKWVQVVFLLSLVTESHRPVDLIEK